LNHISITPQTASSSVIVLLAGDLTMLNVLQECFHGTQRIESLEHNLGIPRLQLTNSSSRLVHLRLLRRLPHREPDRLPPEVEIALYRAIQEALNNVVKHANARNVSVVLDRRKQELRAIVEDDGIGFDPSKVGRSDLKGLKLGLSVIKERLTLLGGSLAVESELSHGTTLFMTVALAEKDSG